MKKSHLQSFNHQMSGDAGSKTAPGKANKSEPNCCLPTTLRFDCLVQLVFSLTALTWELMPLENLKACFKRYTSRAASICKYWDGSKPRT